MQKIAIIDDDEYWLEWISSRIKKDKFSIEKFYDWRDFYKNMNINKYDFIILDYLFIGYNVENTDLESILKKYKGSIFLATHTPKSVKNRKLFKRIFDKKIIKRSESFYFDF